MLALAAGMVAGGHAGERDHDRRTAVESGAVAPLDDLLAVVGKQVPGRVLRVELEDENAHGTRARWIYEVRILTSAGNVIEAKYDAVTLAPLGLRGAHEERREQKERKRHEAD